MKKLFLISLTLIGLTQVGLSAIVQTTQYSTDSWSSTPWSSRVSSSDLINAGQSTLSSSSATTPNFGAGGMNDGSSSFYNFDQNTFYRVDEGQFPAVATYDLDTSINALGYDITSVESFMGWWENMLHQANQTYTVEVSTVGNAGYTLLTTVDYTPFDANTYGSNTEPYGYHYSHVEIADNTGILASGVDSIRFTFSAPEYGVISGAPGTVIRELDVYGAPTAVPEPASIAMLCVVSALGFFIRRRFFDK